MPCGFAVRMQDHALGADPVSALGPLLGGDLGLQLVGFAGVLGEEDQRPGRVGHRETVEHAGDFAQLGLIAHDRNQVANTGAGFGRGMLGGLALRAVLVQTPADLVQLFLDVVDVDKDPGADLGVVLAHGRRQRRPSCSISASASGGPHVPAA